MISIQNRMRRKFHSIFEIFQERKEYVKNLNKRENYYFVYFWYINVIIILLCLFDHDFAGDHFNIQSTTRRKKLRFKINFFHCILILSSKFK